MRYFVVVIGLAAALYGADMTREQELQKAIDLLESKGDLAGAITLFEDAAKSTDRAVAARALLYLAQAQEHQGKERARATYERIARDFGDQRDIAAQARERLAALNAPVIGGPATIRARRLSMKQLAGPHDIEPGTDGRSVLIVRSNSPDIFVQDAATSEIRPLGLASNGKNGFAFAAVYSPDQRQIAYTWFSPPDHGYQLRVISTNAGATPRVLVNRRELRYVQPYAWSPDGKAIIALAWQKDGTASIARISTPDAAYRTLRSLEWRNPERISLSPDGRYVAYDALERLNSADRDIYILAVDGSSEAAVVQSPGIDNNPVWAPDGKFLLFTSNRSRNFGLYAIAVEGGKPRGEARLIKPEVGHIALRGFVTSGSLYYLQLTGDQNIFKADLDRETGALRGAPVPLTGTDDGVNDFAAISPDGKSVAYLSARNSAPEGPGAYTLVVKSLETQIEKAFPADLNVTDAPVWYPDGRALLLGTNSEPPARGRTFCKVDLESGRVTTLEHISGFAGPDRWALAGDGETLYLPGFDPDNGVGRVLVLTLSTGQARTIYENPKDTVASISLSPDGRTLAVGLKRDVLLMDTNGRGARTLTTAWGFGGLGWSQDGNRLYCVREPGRQPELWQIPVSGGQASPAGVQDLRHVRVSRGGTLTYTVGRSDLVDLWALDNVLSVLKVQR